GQPRSIFLSPVNTYALLVEPGGQRRKFRITLTADGRLTGFVFRDSAPKPEGNAPPNQQAGGPSGREATQPPEASRPAAEGALRQLVGDEAASFSLVSESGGERGDSFTWERAAAGEPDVRHQVRALVRDGSVRELRAGASFAPALQDEYNERRNASSFADILQVLSMALAGLLAAVFYLLGWARREVQHRLALVLLGAVFFAAVALRIFGGEVDAALFRLGYDSESAREIMRYGAWAQIIVPAFFYALALALFWGAGHALWRRTDPRRVASLVGLLRGKVLSRHVAAPVAVGVLLGGAFAAAPYLVAASGLFPGLEPARPETQWVASPAPVLAVLTDAISTSLLILYGFVAALFYAYLRWPRVVRALVLGVGLLWMLESVSLRSSVAGGLAVGALLILIADQIFRRYDFLTLGAAALAANVATAASALLVQQPASLRASGWVALAILGLLLVAAVAVSLKGRE
ncbi:MAG: hypothetical protein ACRD68_13715, partial [Pyrinomonadaceae bacterium]